MPALTGRVYLWGLTLYIRKRAAEKGEESSKDRETLLARVAVVVMEAERAAERLWGETRRRRRLRRGRYSCNVGKEKHSVKMITRRGNDTHSGRFSYPMRSFARSRSQRYGQASAMLLQVLLQALVAARARAALASYSVSSSSPFYRFCCFSSSSLPRRLRRLSAWFPSYALREANLIKSWGMFEMLAMHVLLRTWLSSSTRIGNRRWFQNILW